jgi:hypothetical protein
VSMDVCGVCLDWREVKWMDVHIQTEKGCIHAVANCCKACWGDYGPAEVLSVTLVESA